MDMIVVLFCSFDSNLGMIILRRMLACLIRIMKLISEERSKIECICKKPCTENN